MSHGRKFLGLGGCAAILAVAAVLTAPTTAKAEMEPQTDEIGSKVSVELWVDFVSQYIFRGIPQENEGLIAQPSITVTFNDIFELPVSEETTISVSFYGGVWGSIHDNGVASVAGGTSSVYEIDYYFGFTLALPANLTADVSYIILSAPSAGGDFAQEIDLSLAYDATELIAGSLPEGMEGLTAEVYVLFAFETVNGSDGNFTGPTFDQGVYMEVGIGFGYPIEITEDVTLDTSLGVVLGLGLDNYYEDTTPVTDDDTFGFVSIDFGASTGLDQLLGVKYGQWTVSAGVSLVFVGDNAADISAGTIIPAKANGTADEDFFVVATIGFGTEF